MCEDKTQNKGEKKEMHLQSPVTEPKRMEEDLRASGEKYSLVFEHAGLGIGYYDVEGRVVFFNNQASKQMGGKPSDFVGKSVFDLFDQKLATLIMERIQKAVHSETSQVFEDFVSIPTGDKWFVSNYDRICDSRGNVVGVQIISNDITDRKMTENSLNEHTVKFKMLFEHMPSCVAIYEAVNDGEDFVFKDINPAAERTEKIRKEEVIGKGLNALFPGVKAFGLFGVLQRVWKTGKSEYFPPHLYTDARNPGSWRENMVYKLPSGEIVAVYNDVTERENMNELHEMYLKILESLNRKTPARECLREILLLIKKFLGIEAVGVRLKENEDFPYFVSNGLPENFIEAERYLCTRDSSGLIIRDSLGNPYLESMCGNVLCGRINPDLPIFTKYGSFWTNSTTELLAVTGEEDRQTRTRNRCNGEGYESVALIPLHSGTEIIGLLQLNDKKKGRFSLKMIEFFEGIGVSVGIALTSKKTEEALQESERKFRTIIEKSVIGIALATTDGAFRETNASLQRILGYTEEELRHLNITDLTHSEDMVKEMAFAQEIFSGNRDHFQFDKRYLRKDGQIVWGRLTCSLIRDAQGKPEIVLGMVEDITERKKVEEKLKRYQKQLRTLASKLSMVEEQERQRLAIKVHDGIGQSLFLAKLGLRALENLPFHAHSAKIKEVTGILERTINDARSLTYELGSPVLVELGLEAALLNLARESETKYGYQVEFLNDQQEKLLKEDVNIFLYQAVRELLHNVAKHTQASQVKISMERIGREIQVTLEDNGVGFDPAQIEFYPDKDKGFGLFNIRERTNYLGGTFHLESEMGRGTKAILTVPLKL